MSVWPTAEGPTELSTPEGGLLLISIAVEPRRLEALLDSLAQLDFPINPQIYHEASVVYERSSGEAESQTATFVEFPAYEPRLANICEALSQGGFDPACVRAISMLTELHPVPVAENSDTSKYFASHHIKQRSTAGGKL